MIALFQILVESFQLLNCFHSVFLWHLKVNQNEANGSYLTLNCISYAVNLIFYKSRHCVNSLLTINTIVCLTFQI